MSQIRWEDNICRIFIDMESSEWKYFLINNECLWILIRSFSYVLKKNWLLKKLYHVKLVIIRQVNCEVKY